MTDTIPALAVHDVVRLGDSHDWTVRAVTANFAALTRPIDARDRADDEEQAEELAAEYDMHPSEFTHIDGCLGPLYTVVDWRNGVRGPCNLVGQSWGDGTYSEAQCAQMLAEFEAGELEVSHRNRVSIRVVDGTVR